MILRDSWRASSGKLHYRAALWAEILLHVKQVGLKNPEFRDDIRGGDLAEECRRFPIGRFFAHVVL